jgi:hypothetical protein
MLPIQALLDFRVGSQYATISIWHTLARLVRYTPALASVEAEPLIGRCCRHRLPLGNQPHRPAILAADDEPAAMRKLHATSRDRLPLRHDLRILHLLPHHDQVPTQLFIPNATPPGKAKPADRRSTTGSSSNSTKPVLDTDHPHGRK